MSDIQAITARLGEYDFIAVVDCSSSMGEPAKKGGTTTRWQSMQESVMGFLRDLDAIDSDGIDVCELGGQLRTFTGVNSSKVAEMFANMNPRGSTPLAQALQNAFKAAGKSAKKDFIVVWTDGVPDDEAAVRQVILDQANKQDSDDACTVLFIQVGDDARATAYLQSLDDNLKGAKYDIVDAKTIEQADAYNSTAELIAAAIAD